MFFWVVPAQGQEPSPNSALQDNFRHFEGADSENSDFAPQPPVGMKPSAPMSELYSQNTLPTDINFALRVGKREYSNPSVQLLQRLYGHRYKDSIYWQTKKELAKETVLRKHIEKLQKLRNENIKIIINYDSPSQLIPGERIQVFNNRIQQWSSCIVEMDDDINTIAEKLHMTKEELLKQCPNRFNRKIGAQWSSAEVYLGEDLHNLKQTLPSVIAHEVSHIVDGAVFINKTNYGPDGQHWTDEITDEETAWIEGWAEYNQAMFDKDFKAKISRPLQEFSLETRFSRPDKPSFAMITNAKYSIRTACELTVAAVLTAIDKSGEKREQIFAMVKDYNKNPTHQRTMATFANDYIRMNPEECARVLFAIDVCTNFTAKAAELLENAEQGESKSYLERREILRNEFNNGLKSKDFNIQDFYTKYDDKNFPLNVVLPEKDKGEQEDAENQVNHDDLNLLGWNAD